MGDLLLKVLSARKEGSTLLDPSGWPVANSSLNLQPSLLTAISPAHGGPLPNPLHLAISTMIIEIVCIMHAKNNPGPDFLGRKMKPTKEVWQGLVKERSFLAG